MSGPCAPAPHPHPTRQAGVSLLIFTVALAAVVGMVGLVLDIGLAYLAKTRLQNALDAAALSGAKAIFNGGAALATTEATATFNANMNMPGITPLVETSPTLDPFVAGGANPRFVRVSVAALTVPLRLARALPGVGESLDVAGTAVAGPISLGGRICGAIPVMLCGTPGDSDCSDGACFGIGNLGAEVETTFSGDNSTLTTGNYGFITLNCGTGAACLRQALAGGEDICFDEGGMVSTEPGAMTGPAEQGLNTRFGQYGGGLSATQYPPDRVTASVIYYNDYRTRQGNPSSWDVPNGVPGRREVLVPIGDCSVGINGRTDVQILGAACAFLTRPANGSEIRGQLIPTCRATGSVPPNPNPNGPQKIVLYQATPRN